MVTAYVEESDSYILPTALATGYTCTPEFAYLTLPILNHQLKCPELKKELTLFVRFFVYKIEKANTPIRIFWPTQVDSVARIILMRLMWWGVPGHFLLHDFTSLMSSVITWCSWWSGTRGVIARGTEAQIAMMGCRFKVLTPVQGVINLSVLACSYVLTFKQSPVNARWQ